ncbi:hypothetical protein GCM10027428_21350 [Haliea atlantica]
MNGRDFPGQFGVKGEGLFGPQGAIEHQAALEGLWFEALGAYSGRAALRAFGARLWRQQARQQ